MSYDIEFTQSALKEFTALDASIKEQFKNKLKAIAQNPKIPKNKLRGSNAKHLYKIKLKSAGYRLLYEVIDNRLVVVVIKVGRRDSIYKALSK